ncbi:hypothetical protein ACFX2H_042668 [Malus domestica]
MVLVQSESYPGLRWFDLEEEIDEYTETRGMAPHNGEATFVLGSLCLLDGDPVICTRQPRVSRGESNRRSRPGLSISGENLCLFLLVAGFRFSLGPEIVYRGHWEIVYMCHWPYPIGKWNVDESCYERESRRD